MAKIIDFKNREEINPLAEQQVFSGWPMVIGWAAMLIFAIHACTHMVAAGDTWVAMACGRHYTDMAKIKKTILPFYVDNNEPFSANSHKAGPTQENMHTYAEQLRDDAKSESGSNASIIKWWADKADNFENWPGWLQSFAKWIHPTGWINQNWLTHVIFYDLVPKSTYTPSDTFTSNALVYWKFAVYILTIICVYFTARWLGVNPALAAVFACFALFVGRTYFDIRPAGFSNLLVSVFLLVLVLASYRNILYIWLIVPITIFWSNVHGGYLYVFLMLIPFIGLGMLTILPRKWTVTLYAISMWSTLYILSLKLYPQLNKLGQSLFNQTSLYPEPVISQDPLFYILLILIGAAIAITIPKKIPQGLFYGFHIAALALIFLFALAKFAPNTPLDIRMSPDVIRQQFGQCIVNSLLFFILVFVIMLFVGIAISFYKKNLVTLSLRSLVHTALAGVVSFVLMIVVNPFHLTNLTHTFIISFSKHAEMWRQINEWHSSFEWSNLVGTSYPFLIMFLLSILILVFWLFSLFLVPKFTKTLKTGIDKEHQKFNLLLWSFGFLAAVFICWVTLISFSFIGYDLAGFVFAALFTLILYASIYKNIYLIYLLPLFVLFALWSSNPDFINHPLWFKKMNTPYQGRYIYPYLILPAYLIMHLTASGFSRKVKLKPINIVYVLSAALASLILMVVIFNPFNVDLSAGSDGIVKGLKSLFSARVTFKPAYVHNAEPNYTYYFPFLYTINILSIDIWLAFPFIKSLFLQISCEDSEDIPTETNQAKQYQLPKINLGLVVIAALTIYMAVKMRRFIPIAAIAACPVLAMFLDRTIRIVTASINFYKLKQFFVSSMPRHLQTFFIFFAAGIVAFLAVHWGMRFKYVYLDAWPTDDRFTSIFMRMTASDAKPFYAMKFIKDNNISGKMFNYWTEGGFIAWGEQPDPNTGKIPLQLFMDGRAQAAYEPKAYNRWMDIMGGGEPMKEAIRAGLKPSYAQIGKWIDEELSKENVWIVLMPAAEFDEVFTEGLSADKKDWGLIYYDGKQKIFMKKKGRAAEELFNGIFTGKTVFPNDYSKNIILSYYKTSSPDPNERKEALDCAMKAFDEYPSQASIQAVIAASRNPDLKPFVDQTCKRYYDDFMDNKAKYLRQNAFHDRIVAAMLAADYLGEVAASLGDAGLMKNYRDQIIELKTEREELLESKKW
jgi:hypothetical protein